MLVPSTSQATLGATLVWNSKWGTVVNTPTLVPGVIGEEFDDCQHPHNVHVIIASRGGRNVYEYTDH